MQKYKQAAVSIAFLTFILTAGLSFGSFGVISQSRATGGSVTSSVIESLEHGDYEAWKASMNKHQDLAEIVTPVEFSMYTEARQAARNGDYERAIALAQTLEAQLKEKIGAEYFA